ncbi:MAG TPA: aminopeptidase [Spirochaetales bacterium]|nr:aminopeptidase [Spirochaetales bacterium]
MILIGLNTGFSTLVPNPSSSYTRIMQANSFQSFLQPEIEVKYASRVAVTESLKVKEGERVLIITNPVQDVATIAFSVFDAVQEAGGIPVLLFQPVKTQLDFCAEEVAASIGTAPDVVVSLSADKLGKDRKAILEPYVVEGKSYDSAFHYLLYGIKKLRSFWSPGITRDCFIRTVPVDYQKMKTDCEALKTILDRATSLVVENPNGTQVCVGTAGRTSFTDDGDFSRPGTGGNLPAGETFLSPVVGSAEGTIVFDGSIASYGGVIQIQTPIRVHLEKGYVVSVEGGSEAKELETALEKAAQSARSFEAAGKLKAGEGERYARNARHLGELGIGVNRQARITGNMLEDEKVYGTCHFALGSNYDEDAPALIHLDGLVSRPTIYTETGEGKRELVMKEGRFPWE